MARILKDIETKTGHKLEFEGGYWVETNRAKEIVMTSFGMISKGADVLIKLGNGYFMRGDTRG